MRLDATLFGKFFYSSSFFKYPSLYTSYKNDVGKLRFRLYSYHMPPFITLYQTIVSTKTHKEVLWLNSKENVIFYSKREK